jgi:hypothetical protein
MSCGGQIEWQIKESVKGSENSADSLVLSVSDHLDIQTKS